jgi:glycerol kinase
VWQDRRTAAACDELRARGVDALVRMQTGLLLDPYFSATKIAWLLERDDGLRARAEAGEIAFGTVDSWLVWNLTGGTRHVTDVTNASRTMLFDIHGLRWSDELLAAFHVPRAILPDVLPCTADFGTTAVEHFGGAISIAGVAGDQQAALVGQSGFAPGLAKNTYGTGSFVVLNTGDRIVRGEQGLLSTIAFAFEPGRATYALEGSIFVTGAAVQWLRDGLGIIERSADVERLAREVDDSGGCYFVPAFAGLGAPYWDPYARGTIVGVTRGTTRAHLARATLDAMAYQTADVVAAMEREAGITLTELRVDGGASANDFAMQFQADMLGVPVVRPACIETTALGAAYLAGLQVGFWPDIETIARQWREDVRFTPSMDDGRRVESLAHWRRAVERSRDWARD